MRQLLALFLVSALAFSATANFQAIGEIFAGFTFGLNYGDLNPSFGNCSISVNNTKNSAFAAMAAFENTEPEFFEKAVSDFGYNFAHTIRVCTHAHKSLQTLFEVLATEVKEINRTTLYDRLMANLFQINQKFIQGKAAIEAKNYKAIGQIFAEVFRILCHNENTRVVRQLGELSQLISPKMAFDLNATTLGLLGFIEEGNTTFVVNDYLTFVNDTTTLAAQLPILEQAIEKFDFQAIVTAVNTISKFVRFVGTDFTILQGQGAAFVQRDLPLFNNEAGITKAVEALFLDLPTTFTNIQRITNAYKNADYRELGHGSGGVYNQLRNGAMRP